ASLPYKVFYTKGHNMNAILNTITQEQITQQPARRRGRTYMLRLAAEMFKNMDAVKLSYTHGARALHCEVLNPHDGITYEVIILPPAEHGNENQHHSLKEITNGNKENIRGAARALEKAPAAGSR
ncbi:MAG TPA: hypothetical protein VFJ29_03535, partial [Candidatus Kapabacteria bacterium]|nr:hypothetical protein [Candidatus Kapabacteria bacterium]